MSRKGTVSDRFKQKRSKKTKASSYRTQSIRKRYLLVCEGEKTEPYYFKGLEKTLKPGVAIVAVGEGRNTLTLVDQAVQEQKRLEKRGESADEVWVVMDRDSFPAANFDNAIKKCESISFKTADSQKNIFKCAWSNEAFELWYLLHFEAQGDAIGRKDMNRRLTKVLGFKYDKAEKDIYQILQTKNGDESLAIKRAEKLFKDTMPPYSQANPSTTVFQLVEELRQYKK